MTKKTEVAICTAVTIVAALLLNEALAPSTPGYDVVRVRPFGFCELADEQGKYMRCKGSGQ